MRSKLFQAIEKRKSVRDFNSKPIGLPLIQEIEDFIKSLSSLSDGKVSLQIFKNEKEILTASLLTPLASFISSAPYFLAVSAADERNCLMEAGFKSEQVVLFLTEKHLGTCYIGGFLNFGYLEKKLKIPSNERLLLIIPFGHLSHSFMGLWTNSIIETGKFLMGEAGRKTLSEIVFLDYWENDSKEFLLKNKKISEVLAMVRLAPSGANLQPWRFIISGKKIYAFIVSTFKGKIVGNENLWGKDYRELDMGIALSHFEIASQELGLSGTWNFNAVLSKKEQDGLKISSTATLIGIWENNK